MEEQAKRIEAGEAYTAGDGKTPTHTPSKGRKREDHVLRW